MIRRTFLQSLLAGLGLGAFLPKAKAEVKAFPDPFVGTIPDNYCVTFTHQHEPKVDIYDDVVVYGLKNGRPICQLIAQHATITQRTHGAAAKNGKGKTIWKSPPPYRTETEVSLSGLFGPTPLMDTLAAIFGDVMQAKDLSLALVMPEQKKRTDVSYVVLTTIGSGVGGAGGILWSGANFLANEVQYKDDQWDAADLEFLPDPNRRIQAHKALDNLGYDWKVEQERLLDEQLGAALR